MTALRFVACGGFQREMGDIHGVSQGTVSRNVHKVLAKIASLRPIYIKFPLAEEFDELQRSFYQKQQFPGVIGEIDCTHVPIQGPGGDDAELYRNRKGWFSINVQILCDDQLRVRDIVASWKGSTHDSRIFNESNLKTILEGVPGKYHILGDRGYPCLRYLLTPLTQPQTPSDKRYNFAQSSTRMVIERLNGILKRRFPCLASKLRFSPKRSSTVVVACAVLQNLSIALNDNDPDENEEEIDFNEEEYAYHDNSQGVAKRRAIIVQHF